MPHGMHAAKVAPAKCTGNGALMPVTLTVCSSCKSAPLPASGSSQPSDGERLAAALEAEAGNRSAAVRIIRHECLWACRQSCVVLIQDAGKTGYLAGRFEAGAAAAEAILDWVAVHGESATGEVPYAQWPEGMKGHFIARIPGAYPFR